MSESGNFPFLQSHGNKPDNPSKRQLLQAVYDFEPMKMSETEKEDLRKILILEEEERDLDEFWDLETLSSLCEFALHLKRGDWMETVLPIEIGDTTQWWKVFLRHNRKEGYVPRDRIVIDYNRSEDEGNQKQDDSKSSLTAHEDLLAINYSEKPTFSNSVNSLPLELVDIILLKSYLHLALRGQPPYSSDNNIINLLAAVDFCWFQRTQRKKFKNTVLLQLSVIYERSWKRRTLIRNNREYLMENITPHEKLLTLLRSVNCLTEEQVHTIRNLRLDKNYELLHHAKRTFDEEQYSAFVNSLRQTDQSHIARVISNGGVVVKADVKCLDATYKMSFYSQLDKAIKNLQTQTGPRHPDLRTLRTKGIEILSGRQDKDFVVWIWCRSQNSLQHLQTMLEYKSLLNVFVELCGHPISASKEANQILTVTLDDDQCSRKAVLFPFAVNFTKSLQLEDDDKVRSVTKLRDKIYVLCHRNTSCVILVFEENSPFLLQRKLELTDVEYTMHIVSSPMGNCLYVTDIKRKDSVGIVWKVTELDQENDAEHKVTKWLFPVKQPFTMSVCRNGHLLMVNWVSIEPDERSHGDQYTRSAVDCQINVYGHEADLVHSITLDKHIQGAAHAAETSEGNFVIIHHGDNTNPATAKWAVSELSRDGTQVIRRFYPENEEQTISSGYIWIDSYDRVLLSNTSLKHDGRIIVLDYNFQWNFVLISRNDARLQGTNIRSPSSLFYDEDKRQIVLTGIFPEGANVYSVSQL